MSQQSRIGRTATSIYTENGFTSVRYHSTEVVKFNHEKIILNTGGWHTFTTKTRMNQASRQLNWVTAYPKRIMNGLCLSRANHYHS